jgi:hypothetical protein
MIISIGIHGEGSVNDAEGIVSEESFTSVEFAALAFELETLATEAADNPLMRRLTDMLWALQNDTDACILYNRDALPEQG